MNNFAGEARSDEPLQELPARRGFSLSYKGKTLLSRIDPIGQAERAADSLVLRDRTLYFCPSPLYGYGLSQLVEKMRANTDAVNSAILCVETDDKLFDLSKRSMKPLLDEGGEHLLLTKPGTDEESAVQLCGLVKRTWGERRFRRVEILRLTGGWQLFPDLYERMTAVLGRDIALSWGNAITLIRMGRLYIRNAIRNLALVPQAADISGLDFGADPVLVLGAGPGMDIMLDELNAHFEITSLEKRPFKIICVDTCIPCLMERDIEPDLVVILESQHWNLRDFSGARGWKVPAAVDLSCLPASRRVLGGEIFLFAIPWTRLRIFSRLEEAGLLPPGLTPLGSVGLTAAELARRLSTGPIVTAGLDFSFTLDAYHARSSPGHLARLAKGSRFNSLLNLEAAFREGTFAALSKSGLSVRSDPAMRNYRSLFEEAFSSSPRFYEINGPGLPLGVKKLEAKEAVKVLCGFQDPSDSDNGFKKKPEKNLSGITEKSTRVPVSCPSQKREKDRAFREFVQNEKDFLLKFRDALTGKTTISLEEKEKLLDTLDYLWAHFPECAAAGGRRPLASDLSFVKRVRTEIDPFLKLWEEALRESDNQ